MTDALELVGGWTGDLDFRLLADNVGVDLTGCTIELLLTNAVTGASVATSGDISIACSTGGRVSYSPDSGDLAVGSYRARWKLTDASSKIVYFPNSLPDTWTVRSA